MFNLRKSKTVNYLITIDYIITKVIRLKKLDNDTLPFRRKDTQCLVSFGVGNYNKKNSEHFFNFHIIVTHFNKSDISILRL